MITELRTSYLNSSELSLLAARLLEITEGKGAGYPYLADLTGLLKGDTEEMAKIETRNKTNEYTRKVQEQDDIRDDAFLSFRNQMSAYLTRSDENIKANARQIVDVIRKHGWRIYDLNLREESIKLKALITELEEEKNQNAIEALEGVKLFRSMVREQEVFEEVLALQVEARGTNDVLPVSVVKASLARHLSAFLDFFRITGELRSEEFAGEIIRLNETIEDFMTAARTRKTLKNKEDSPGE